MKRFTLHIAMVMLFPAANLVAAEKTAEISLKELVTRVSLKIGAAGIADDQQARLQAEIAAEARLMGDTGLELESELKNGEREGSYTAILQQPFRLGSAHVKRALELDSEISRFETDRLIRAATQQAAELILEQGRIRARQHELEKVSVFYSELSKRLKTGVLSGQSSALVSQQVSELLRQNQEEIQINLISMADLKEALLSWGIDGADFTSLGIPAVDGKVTDADVASVPEVARFNVEASAAAVRAAEASGQFEFNLGIGAQKAQSDGTVSYLVKLEAPIGQLYSNQQKSKVHLRDKSVNEGRARVEAALAKHKIAGILSRLKRANAEKSSLIEKNKGTQSIFEVAKSGYERGALSFIELRDGFDQMVGSRFELIELAKTIQLLQLELFLFTGGAA